MSEIKLNLLELNNAINGTVHGSFADSLIAAVSAEPETIAELEAALDRYIKRLDDHPHFASFRAGEDFEPWDAGLVIVDLSARTVAVESSYSSPELTGEVPYHNGKQATEVVLPYRIPDDWLILHSVLEYEACRETRVLERAANPPLDARHVLYGTAMREFLISECIVEIESGQAAPEPEPEPDAVTPIAEIHARWLMTARADLRGQTPREVILQKLNFIDLDLQMRELHWSLVGEGPPPLLRESHAYRFGGFGTHEFVLYYDLIRHLLEACWERLLRRDPIDQANAGWLDEIETAWLNTPQGELSGRVPSFIIESERRRVPMAVSADSMFLDENCEFCLAAREEGGVAFWHLDGCNIDDRFEFSTHLTRVEWEKEQEEWRRFTEEFDRKWAIDHGKDAGQKQE